MLARTFALLLCTLAALPVLGASNLVTFVEGKGCKLLGSEAAVARLQEIAVQGSVVWQGRCKGGFIDGKGLLREEGSVIVDGKTRKYAYFLSGVARKGLRQGRWTRETYERFADSTKFFTSAATVSFTAGVAKGRPKLTPIRNLDQLTPAFRQFVIEARREAAPANEALRSVDGGDAPVPPMVVKPVEGLPPKGAGVAVTASTQHESLGPAGLLVSAQPGWQSASPPDYPEWVSVNFRTVRKITVLGLRAQDGQPARAPKVIRVESSDDGVTWSAQVASEIPCVPNSADGWLRMHLLAPAIGRYLKIVILANCGDAEFVALRGIQFK
jgi:hypothetical protein